MYVIQENTDVWLGIIPNSFEDDVKIQPHVSWRRAEHSNLNGLGILALDDPLLSPHGIWKRVIGVPSCFLFFDV